MVREGGGREGPGWFSDRKRYPNGNITRTSDFEVFVSIFPVRILI